MNVVVQTRSPLKVVHLIPTLWQGGAQRLLTDLCNSSGPETNHVIVRLFGSVFFELPPEKLRSVQFPMPLRVTKIPKILAAIWRLRRILREENPDIVHCWMYYADALSLVVPRRGPKIIWSIHNTTLMFGKSNPLLHLADWICRITSRWVPDRIVYCTHAAQKLHERHGYATIKSVVIPNGIQLSTFRPRQDLRRQTRADLHILDEQVVIGFFARWDPQKNFGFVFDAIARAKSGLAPFKLILAGSGNDVSNKELVGLLNERGLFDDAILLDAVPHVEHYLNASDIVVLGSSYGEALPMTLIEAVVCERAVVTTNIGDVCILGLPNDSVVPPEDVVSFSKALVREAATWRDGSTAALRAAAAGHLGEQFSIETCALAYESVYRDLIYGDGSDVGRKTVQ
jgi:glycosyltransferase involved in cell wall biosynthesis